MHRIQPVIRRGLHMLKFKIVGKFRWCGISKSALYTLENKEYLNLDIICVQALYARFNQSVKSIMKEMLMGTLNSKVSYHRYHAIIKGKLQGRVIGLSCNELERRISLNKINYT
ncbi:hypothetical protein RF11_02703 [Thelohanellus kitauei]|uniref:Uncharacterized protein n=1 Tax=Thelohanellus kitauei TaxID=669202 RepID=A0A0C2J847_THEKT|nr:hypothetical protein RF11_02703 [Thelohanellus kitauei]